MHVFTYGSLMYAPVWDRVVSGRYRSLVGTVRGYERRRISGEVYPALVRVSAGSAVEGRLYLDVTAADLAALDRFEGDAYARIEVTVEGSDGASRAAWSYLYLDASRLEEAPWEPEGFQGADLQHFLDTYCRDRAQRRASPDTEKR